MAWRFNETVPLVLTRQEASEIYEELQLYCNECDQGDDSIPAIRNVIERMKRHTETRRATERP